jgi:hypothetical protein
MRRAVILAILALLLLAVADVTAAQEGVFESAEPGVDVSETTVPENIAPEPTGPHRLAGFLDLGRLLVGVLSSAAVGSAFVRSGRTRVPKKPVRADGLRARTGLGTWAAAGGRSPSATRARRR